MSQEDQIVEEEYSESLSDLEVSAEEAYDTNGGTGLGVGKVSMQDFHFVVHNGSA